MNIEEMYIGQEVNSVNNPWLRIPYIVTALNIPRNIVDVKLGREEYKGIQAYMLMPYKKK